MVGLKTAVQQDREDRRCGGTEDSCAAGQRRQKVWWDRRQLCSRTEKTEGVVGLKTAVQQDREDRRCGGTKDSCAAGQRRQKVWWD